MCLAPLRYAEGAEPIGGIDIVAGADRFFKPRRYLSAAFKAQLDAVVVSQEYVLLACSRSEESSIKYWRLTTGAVRCCAGALHSHRRRRPVVLEVGCGSGSNVFPLLDEFPAMTAWATDFSSAALEVGSRRVQRRGVVFAACCLVQPARVLHVWRWCSYVAAMPCRR